MSDSKTTAQAQELEQRPSLKMSHELGGYGKDDAEPDLEEDDDDEDPALVLVVRDGLDAPVEGLRLIFTFPWGEKATGLTSSQGVIAIPLPDKNRTGQVQVEVQDVKSEKQKICTLDLKQCAKTAIVNSPKTVIDLSLRLHDQKPPATSTPSSPQDKALSKSKGDPNQKWWVQNGAAGNASEKVVEKAGPASSASLQGGALSAQGIDKRGNPITAVIAPEGANKDNLRMGRNNIYRDAILGASKRLGLIPQSLCALIDCEAAKKTEWLILTGPDGKTPLLDKKKRPRKKPLGEVWDANSTNGTGAAGLTQFLVPTWLDHVMRPGFFIHESSKDKGWVKQEEVKPTGLKKALKIVPLAKPKMRWVFVLADGSTTVTPRKFKSDAHVKACLDMRFDPEWSINAAADYGSFNLKVLTSRGYDLSALNDMNKAKMMYLLHHEGEGGGPAFIEDKCANVVGGEDALRKKFKAQGNKKTIKEWLDKYKDDVEAAYRGWLSNYVDDKFSSSAKYFVEKPVVADNLGDLIKKLGGVEVKAS